MRIWFVSVSVMKLTEDEAKLSRMINEISGDSPICKTDSPEFKKLLDDYEKARKWEDFKKLYQVNDEWLLDQQDYKIAYQKLRELIEKRIEELQMVYETENGLIDEYQFLLTELQKLLQESKKN